MSHFLDPRRLQDPMQYHAALNELNDLLQSDLDTPAGRRLDELAALIEEYDRQPLAENHSGILRVAI